VSSKWATQELKFLPVQILRMAEICCFSGTFVRLTLEERAGAASGVAVLLAGLRIVTGLSAGPSDAWDQSSHHHTEREFTSEKVFVKHVLWVFQIHQEWSISPYSGIFFGNCVPNVVPPIFPDALASTGMTLHDR